MWITIIILSIIVLAVILYITRPKITIEEGFAPISTCAKDPYREDYKVFYKTVDVTMCDKQDRCEVTKDEKGRVEFALCVGPNEVVNA